MTNPDETLPVELLGCPFCGGNEAKVAGYNSCDCCGKAWNGQVICQKCGASRDHFDTDEEAIAAWNTRAAQSPPPVSEMVERLRKHAPVLKASVFAQAGITCDQAADLIERPSSPSPGCDAETIEACAKVADKWAEQDVDPAARRMAEDIAAAIRNLGKEQG